MNKKYEYLTRDIYGNNQGEINRIIEHMHSFGWVIDNHVANVKGGELKGFSGYEDEYGYVDLTPDYSDTYVSSHKIRFKRDLDLRDYDKIVAYEKEYYETQEEYEECRKIVAAKKGTKFVVPGIIITAISIAFFLSSLMCLSQVINGLYGTEMSSVYISGGLGAVVLAIGLTLLIIGIKRKKCGGLRKKLIELSDKMSKIKKTSAITVRLRTFDEENDEVIYKSN